MNDGDHIRRAILDSPEDDLPRLAYADWLEENDDHKYAHNVRWMLERPQKRVNFPIQGGGHLAFRRGFAESAEVGMKHWMLHGPALVRHCPIVKVKIVNKGPACIDHGLRPDPWTWDDGNSDLAFSIPYEVGRLIIGRKWFPTDADANDALGDACLRWAKTPEAFDRLEPWHRDELDEWASDIPRRIANVVLLEAKPIPVRVRVPPDLLR